MLNSSIHLVVFFKKNFIYIFICLFILLSIYLFFGNLFSRSFICLFIVSFIYLLIFLFSSIHSTHFLFHYSNICLFTHLFVCSFIYSFTLCSLIHLFVHSLIRSFPFLLDYFIWSSVRLFICLIINLSLNLLIC